MEIVLQWLDELDDLVFAGFAVWPRVRRFCLGVALLAAIALHVLPQFGIATTDSFALLDISLAALAIWVLLAVISAGASASRHSLAENA